MAGRPTSQGRLGRKKRLGSNNRRCDMQLQVPWLKPAAWGVVVGAAGAMIIGFSWLGWTLGSTAERMASERTTAAVVRSEERRVGKGVGLGSCGTYYEEEDG